ncbi:MAG TPA: ABC transporter permease [Acidimicrobiia bacterium]|nr:ABC transporter permease [Acidimicrobiia bacterium]
MSSFKTVWRIALREIREHGRSRAFLITTALTFLLVAGLVVVPGLIGGGTSEYTVGGVGEGNESIVASAELLGNASDEPDVEPSVAIELRPFEDRGSAEAIMEEGELDAILINGQEVIVESVGGFGDSAVLSLLQRGAASVELEGIVTESGQAAADVIEVMTSDPLETTTLSGPEAGDETRGAVAYAGLLLLYMAVLLYGNWMLSGVTEEKSNRVVEVLLSSVKPWQLLAGKISGIGLLGIGQFAGTILVAVVAVQLSNVVELPSLDVATVANLIVWFVLGFLLFAVMYGAAGSLVSRMEDAQNVAFPMSMIAVAGFFVSIAALSDPDGPAAVIGTLIPLTAPFVVPVRAALGSIPTWQYVLAVVLTLGAIVGLVFVAGRIYAGGLLRFGTRVKLRDAWRSAGT